MAQAMGGALLICLAALCGCGRGESARPEHPVVLIGFDGLEWSVAGPLIRAGRMPNLKALIERGVAGSLDPHRESLSPVIWTTIATGKTKQDHGIVDFLTPGAKKIPFTSEARRGKALWNIAGDYGLMSLVVGWWITWPAEEINGWMVAPYSSLGQNDFNWKGNMRPDIEGQTWPPELFQEVWPIAEQVSAPDNLARLGGELFGALEVSSLSDTEQMLVNQTLWSVAADETYLRAVLHLLGKEEKQPDLTLFYGGGTDVSGHRFWRYYEPERFSYEVTAAEVLRFGDVINRFYEQADQYLGQALAAAPADANVIVCSDHGFHADFTDRLPPGGFSGHHLDGPPGMIVLAGPSFRQGVGGSAVLSGKGTPARIGYVYDVAPLVLYLLDIPAGRDMQSPEGGNLLKNAVRPEQLEARPLEVIRSHDVGFRPAKVPTELSGEATQEFMDVLNRLGYLGGKGE